MACKSCQRAAKGAAKQSIPIRVKGGATLGKLAVNHAADLVNPLVALFSRVRRKQVDAVRRNNLETILCGHVSKRKRGEKDAPTSARSASTGRTAEHFVMSMTPFGVMSSLVLKYESVWKVNTNHRWCHV